MRRITSLVAAVAIVTAIAGCSSGGASSTSTASSSPITAAEKKLYDAAKSEPTLTWYSGQDPDRNDAVIAAFTKKFPGLKVTSFRLASGQLADRYSQEKQSGVNTAGLITIGDPAFVKQGQQEGWFDSTTPAEFPELKSFPSDFYRDGVPTAGINVFGIGYNTNNVTTPPKTWKDVLDPKYKGKIIFGDPRNVPGYIALAKVWDDAYGDSFLQSLAKQNLTIVDSMVPGVQQVGAGEGDIGLPSVLTVVKPVKDKGAPLGMVVPDVTTGNEYQNLIPANAPSPNTAKLLFEFMLTDEGQSAFNGTTGASPINATGTPPLPKGYKVVSPEDIDSNRARLLGLLGISAG